MVAYPAEACFGLGCDPRNKKAVERIRELKNRRPGQGFILVSDSLERLLPYLDWNSLAPRRREKISASWPGPVTWLIPALPKVGPELIGQHTTLAVRVSAFETLRTLCATAQSALLSSSANYQGQEPLTAAADVANVFADKIDYIIDLPIQGLDKTSSITDAITLHTIRP